MEETVMVYLAGKITGDPNYREKFSAAAAELNKAGYAVINPALLPDGLDYAAYIRISSAMLDECDSVCFLPDWIESRGATHEYDRARLCDKHRFEYDGWLKTRKGDISENG